MSANSSYLSGLEEAGAAAKKDSITARTEERSSTTQAHASDPKYKKYVQQVEKCLNSFDNVHEWADCIAFLKQLLKTFQSYTQFKEIPRKLIVAKRLSQCLNPALPTGVHQRALDVYTHILTVIGPDGLRRDLPLWSSGLFPFFEYAATSVKPTLINIFEAYYLPLLGGLRPVMKAFILALLPGLEEETGEFFEKVISLLDRLAGTVSLSFFFQNIWLIMLTTPPARGTSLNFLARRLPTLNADEDIADVVGRDIGLMIRAFAAALEDENLLVRRGALDLLLQTMRVDSFAIKKAHADDRGILMRAATGVVLRRDLSLNRRLYTWLLGSDEKSDQQMAYLKKNGLDLLYSTLKTEMESPPGDYSESRPFKIFISLLDKWEIGAPLTEVLAHDSFKASKRLMENPPDGAEDLTMTASTLYEAVEPRIIWKQLLSAIFAEISGDGNHFEESKLVRFILNTFSQDEEIQTIHLPIVFDAILDFVNLQVQNDPEKASSQSIREIIHVLEDILRHIPHPALLQRTQLSENVDNKVALERPYTFACTFFGIPTTMSTSASTGATTTPLGTSFENLVSLSMLYAQRLEPSKDVISTREAFSQSLLLMEKLAGRLVSPLSVSWDPAQWLSCILQSLEHKSARFVTLDRAVSLAVALHRNHFLEPRLNLDQRPIVFKMINKLLQYLRPDCATYHVRAVNLIWSLESSTTHSHVESTVAQSMTCPGSHEAYEAFGVLWRLTEDNLLPGFCFKVPMMIVLETLKSDNPSLRRVGETWMRCSLKSYLRILDPILYDLLDPSILRSSIVTKVRGRELQGFNYERPFDQRYVNHLLEILLSVIRFGGQGFAKTARSSPVVRSHHNGLVQRVEKGGLLTSDVSYMDVMVEVLLRFLLTEPKQVWFSSMQPFNAVIQSTAVELLQLIVARGEIDSLSVETIEAAIVGKLYFAVHTTRLDLQNKLLHLLHSLISVSTSVLEAARHASAAGDQQQGDSTSDEANLGEKADSKIRYPVNPLLIQTLIDGISTRTNRPVLQHWLDFILMALPQFQPALQAVVAPLNDCLCRQALSTLVELLHTSSTRQDNDDSTSSVTDAELIMFFNGLERLILLSLAYPSESSSSEEETAAEKPETGGLFGYVSNVFSSESNQSGTGEQLTARSPGYRSLDEGIRVLYSAWAALNWRQTASTTSQDETLIQIFSRSRLRCGRVLEHLFRVQSAEVFESIVECWSRELPIAAPSPDAAFELVDVLLATAQNVVHMICESISCRMTGASEKSKGRAINPNLTDAVLFDFLEKYFSRLEGPLALQVWGRYLQLVKEIIGSTRDFKPQNFPALRCLSVLAEKVTQTTAMEDRRIRKELQDFFGKLLDSCVVFVGRSTDQGSWIRRSTKETLTANGRDSPVARPDDKADSIINTVPLETPKAGSMELVNQICLFVASSALPNLRKFLIENDKVTAACSNIVYYIVTPSLRGRAKPMDVEPTIISIIREMTRIPAAVKAWRNTVIELLNDNRLFNCLPNEAERWRPVVKVLFDFDKSAFPELLGKVAGAPSANIFANKEYEMLLRSLNIRRLSYAIFASDKNHFLTQLPTIQEKLVDILRNASAPIVQSKVLLCVRVLLCRLSAHNLTSFWPHLLTELYRIFEQTINNLPSDGSEDLQLILAASKCLDLLLVLQTEEFQIHQWIFITDTVDAIYHPDDWFPEAMMDQLAEVAGSLPISGAQPRIASPNHISSFNSQRPMRRPLLNSLHQIESIRDLIPFFSNVSISSYESVYASGGNVDWEAVEKGIMDDMFEGQ